MSLSKKTAITKAVGVLFFIGAAYLLVRSVILCFSNDIWYDELFSMEFAKRPVPELISLTARDVHPPLYYIIVRAFLLMGDGLGIVGNSSGQLAPEIIAKLVSILPFIILMIYNATTVRKHFGILAAGIFSFAIVSMPQLPEYTTEIRMYSYAILFVTAALLHGFGLIRNMKAENGTGWDIPDSLGILLYSVAAAYTHYYAALSVGVIYGILFVWMLCTYIRNMKKPASSREKINFKAPAAVLITMNLAAISYIPWISALASQVGAVKANYWIQPLGLRTLGSCAKYLFKGYYANDKLAAVLAVAFFALIAILFIRTVIRAVMRKELNDCLTLYAFAVLVLVVLGGLAASALIRPVFVSRYMLPAYGAFWLSVAIMVGKELEDAADSKSGPKRQGTALAAAAVPILLMILIAVTGIVDFKTFIGNEEYRKVKMEETLALFDSLPSDTIIISNFDHVQALLSYYLNDGEQDYHVYLYGAQPEELIKETVPGLETIEDPIDIRNYLDAEKSVLFLGSFNSREVLLQEWNEQYGITSKNEGSYLMERYWFDVFRLR